MAARVDVLGPPQTITRTFRVDPRRSARKADARVWLDVDLANIRTNYRTIRDAVYPLQVMAVLKANAYGLGVLPIAQCLHEAGVARFAVAEVREALTIRELGVPTLVLGGLIDKEVPVVVESGIHAPIADLRMARVLSAEAVRQKREVTCHFVLDTGMGRLGLVYEEAEAVIREAVRLPGLRCEGLYSHFPVAYEDYDFSVYQVQRCKDLVARLAADGICFDCLHIANSDGINNIPAACRAPFTMVRTGINLYGVFDLQGRRAQPLQPVLKLKTTLVAVRELPAGSTIGYGQTFKLRTPTLIGTIAIGYADGLPVQMSNCGMVTVRGKPCPIRGRVSMDYTTVSLEAAPEAEVGDEVVCLADNADVAEWATRKGTLPYDIICSIGNRVERRYLDRVPDV